MNQPTAEQLEVTQADRDAAAASYFGFLASIRGEEDGISLARSFARHRQATEARMAAAVEAERERILVIVADQKKAANESDKWPKYHGMAGSYMQGAYVNACANIEAAIRSADDGQG